MATQPGQLSRSIASAVSRAVERAVDQALASLPSLPGNSGFAPATQEVCNIDVSLLKHPSGCRGDDLCVDVINKKNHYGCLPSASSNSYMLHCIISSPPGVEV